ncbi:MAG: FtsQ-type POTRA domain-containing protein, partial [Candidatus Competibacteraceae bacterium]|nr:FtsQ-type POTRA domain-containing protein [Candidatus Competibacteraceae bacterium]
MADHALSMGKPYSSRRSSSNGPLVAALAVVILIIAAEIAFHVLVAPNLTIRRVILEGDIPLPRAELERLCGLGSTTFYFSTDASSVAQNLQTAPAVRRAVVEKIFPDALKIRMEARTPLGIAFAETDGGLVPVAFDEDGMIFQEGEGLSDLSLPVFSGLRFEGVRLGSRLPAAVAP